MHIRDLKINQYDYYLPQEKIAIYPLRKRDESKLLIYKNGNIKESIYRDLGNFLPNDSLLVFNKTKVINARLVFYKDTGAKIEVFCLEPDSRYLGVDHAMRQEKEVYWKCMVGGLGKWKDGQLITLNIPVSQLKIQAKLIEKGKESCVVKLSWENKNKKVYTFAEVLAIAGQIPLPPYLNRAAEPSDTGSYQTVFAQDLGSVAAPTAALHFTDELIGKLNIQTAFITLHVGAGTFKPVTSELIQHHLMHAEWVNVSLDFLEKLLEQIREQKPVIAVGTTSVRTLESLYWIGVRIMRKEEMNFDDVTVHQWYPYDYPANIAVVEAIEALIFFLKENSLDHLTTRTEIMIIPGYEFRLINALITNFHQPGSTLILLVAALVGEDWKTIYQYALNNHFRFLSYGDGSLLWNSK